MVFQFSLDKYLNPYIPPSIVPKLPLFIGRWLGKHHKLSKQAKHEYFVWLDVLIGTFVGLLTLEGIFMHSKVFINHHAPILIASYGATAILLFNANQVPLAQPRNIVMGQFLSALVGVIILKLFELSEAGKEHLYVGAALSTAIASVVMTVFNCVHPPSGATALIPLIDAEIAKMGWWYLPAHLVSSVVIVGVGLITNNVLRSYPVYFWTAYTRPVVKPVDEETLDTERTKTEAAVDGNSAEDALHKVDSSGVNVVLTKNNDKIVIDLDKIAVPEDLDLSDVEFLVLDAIKMKLQTLNTGK